MFVPRDLFDSQQTNTSDVAAADWPRGLAVSGTVRFDFAHDIAAQRRMRRDGFSRMAKTKAASPAESSVGPQAAIREGDTLARGRLQVVQLLGRGGMGVVYRAFDQERRCSVALKTLNQVDAPGIYQLKTEFRALAEVHHPNLVRLHELFFDRDLWFFTMDLVEGEPFDRWVRPGGQLDQGRLRSSLCQLLDALEAIHLKGKLHRDIKPGNVLVAADGQLYVLDFGLVIDPSAGTVGQTLTDLDVTGTPDYMAPEQAAGLPACTATDFYALGVMLFEAMTGKRPFEGSLGEILAAKQRDHAPRPIGVDIPAELESLCLQLLARDAADRPDSDSIRRALQGEATRRSSPVQGQRVTHARTCLVGRRSELQALHAAYKIACNGTPVVITVTGDSGMGKTALCQAFLRELADTGHAVVLSGRCYEHENVPFKLLDPVIDELSRYLRRLRPDQAAALLPRDVFALAQLFPVLMRVDVVAAAPTRPVPEARELQRLGFRALGELFARIRDRQPLVIYVDDLQWTDPDSAKFARHLLVSRELVPALYVASHRNDDQQPNSFVDMLVAAARSNRGFEIRQVVLPPLTAAETAELAEQTVGPRAGATAAAIATESRGNPYFAMELARFATAHDDSVRAPSLASMIEARVAALPRDTRVLLQLVALAGQPLPADVLLYNGQGPSALQTLCDCQLLRGREGTSHKYFECYHDRVRETVRAALSDAERFNLYRGLARALANHDEPELLSRCLEAVGEFEQAGRYAAVAAERASEALAFEQAAELYRRALQLAPGDRLTLLSRLGQALENAGRGLEAAAVYLDAAGFTDPEPGLDLKRRGAEQMMVNGRIEQGAELLREVCKALDLRLPRDTVDAILSLAWFRLRLRLHPLAQLSVAVRPAGATTLPPLHALRLRCLRSAVTGLVGYLPIQAAAASALYLLEAYGCPDPAERIRASGFYAHMNSLTDPHGALVRGLLTQMDRLAEREQRPELIGFARLMHGTAAYNREQYVEARRHLELGRTALQQGSGVDWWELDATQVYDQLSAFYCGDYADIARTTPSLLDEALRRGRSWSLAMLSGFAAMPAWLATGDVEGYRTRLREARAVWHAAEVPAWPDYMLLVADVLLEVFIGQPERGFERFETHYALYRRTLIARGSRAVGIGYATHRATCAAAALVTTRTNSPKVRRRLLAALRDSIEILELHGGSKSRAMSKVFGAALAFHSAAPERAAQDLCVALPLLERAGARMHVAAVKRRLGAMLGGGEGAQLVASGDEFMQGQGVTSIEAMTELNCPGLRT
jgi:hypothetical protein